MIRESPHRPEIDEIVERHLSPSKPGAAVTVIQGGQIIHSAGYGLANMEWDQPVTTNSVFGIGSTTKPFTATAMMLLERERLVDLAAPLTEYLPDYDTHGATITLTHLLTHTSGIPNFVTMPGYWERVAPLDHDHTQLRALFEEAPLDFAPGERYSYSNSGYCLLGMIIERLSGVPYQQFIRERIFAPLDMTSSGYLDRGAVIPRLAAPYTPNGDGMVTYPRPVSPTLVYSAGALCSTVEDLARWDTALREATLLDRATLARMEQPLTLNDRSHQGYGLGWGLSTYRGRPVIHHAGGVPGYSAFFARFPEDDLTIIILSNRGLFDSGSLLARPIASLLLGLPVPASPTSPVEADLSSAMGTYDNRINDIIEFREVEGGVRASGELTATLIPTGVAIYRQTDDPDVSVQFEDKGPHGYRRATVTVPFYWYTVYRREQ